MLKNHKMIVFVASVLFFLFNSSFTNAGHIKKIMFIVHTETIGGKGVLELYKEFKKNGHEVTIVALPFLNNKNEIRFDIDLEFTKKFDKEDVVYPCGVHAPYTACKGMGDYKADYIFIQNPYDPYKGSLLDPYFTLSGLKKITDKLAYIVYGPHLFHQDSLNNTKLKNHVDMVFVDSESTKKIFEERLLFSPKNVVVSGFQSYKNVREKIKSYKKKESPYKETILWMPRWTLSFNGRNLHEGGSTFLNYHHFIYNYAKQNQDIKFIIRPHTLLFKYAVESQFLTQEDADEIIGKFKSLKNVIFSDHESNCLDEDIIESDIIISDGTSALGEVVVADKPIIYLSNGWDNEFNSNDLSAEFKKFIYFARQPSEIIESIEFIR
nr:hypothetical protein [Alphaproteobacteria bacterium]